MKQESLNLRPPHQVMRMERMGVAFQSRISFSRILLRRMQREQWQIERRKFSLDDHGYGTAVYTAVGPHRAYSLVAFSDHLNDSARTDRVIAEKWDATFVLYDGIPSSEVIARLRLNVPRQEAGRFVESEIVLSRANRSVRLFDYITDQLSSGVQPDKDKLIDVGYLMRTTAVYGNGKFGVMDRESLLDRQELVGPFQAEMLTVYLIRCFSIDQIEHIASRRCPTTFTPLKKSYKRFLGVGNATGLGMAPFLVTHPELIHSWVYAKECALARVRETVVVTSKKLEKFSHLITTLKQHLTQWRVEDAKQSSNIVCLQRDLKNLTAFLQSPEFLSQTTLQWDFVYRWSEEKCTLESQELIVSMLIELYPELVDELEKKLSVDRRIIIDTSQSIHQLLHNIESIYDWALTIDFENRKNQTYFWYVSANKLEPRLGYRFSEEGADKEMALDIARAVQKLHKRLLKTDRQCTLMEFLLRYPDHRHTVNRVQTIQTYLYGEIRDNLIGRNCTPVDLLRYKLAFMGASKFDPKSSLWTRITLFQGAPLIDELTKMSCDDYCFPVIN